MTPIRRYGLNNRVWVGYPMKTIRVETIGVYTLTLFCQQREWGAKPLYRVEVNEQWRRVQNISDLSKGAAARLFDSVADILKVETAKEALGLSKGLSFDLARRSTLLAYAK